MNAFRYVQGVGGSCLDNEYPYLAYVSYSISIHLADTTVSPFEGVAVC